MRVEGRARTKRGKRRDQEGEEEGPRGGRGGTKRGKRRDQEGEEEGGLSKWVSLQMSFQ